jgi:hypothetical protein
MLLDERNQRINTKITAQPRAGHLWVKTNPETTPRQIVFQIDIVASDDPRCSLRYCNFFAVA